LELLYSAKQLDLKENNWYWSSSKRNWKNRRKNTAKFRSKVQCNGI